jgi:hypothetical protein
MRTSVYPDLTGRVVRLPSTFKGGPRLDQPFPAEPPSNVVRLPYRRTVDTPPGVSPELLLILALVEAINERDLAARQGKPEPRPLWTCISGTLTELLQEAAHELPAPSPDVRAALAVILATGSRPLRRFVETHLSKELSDD